MKHKKEFFGVFFSVIVSVFLVFLGVYAATTIGNDISITDDLTITGNALTFGNGASLSNSDTDLLTITETLVLISGKASISGDLQIEGNDLSFGNGAALSNAADTELLTITETLVSIVGKASVSSDFYVGGNTTFDGYASLSEDTGLVFGGGAKLFGGTASPAGTTLNCTIGSWYFRAGQGVSASIHYCAVANEWDLAEFLGN
ncbi:MAG: hypothetical protein ABIH51_01780 [Patescibacteria group bacterium]